MNDQAVLFRTALATYTVSEMTDDQGFVTIKFETTNPPQGLDMTLYAWTGRPSALAVPPLPPLGRGESEAS